ncbi:Eukaryotic translation initiation factor 3 subunit L [Neolecta irregularis DAH-3]|uniref:Eukaryotic translation initiation factor 3 subunit L n=1 Tax=Neolecta irregularis (strain DAH-3) TaxID=1198029 RepID=A0A1U7LUU2_NEOID|nr:Eukaryotic translation initiation factor 3 subunit L [Neolecta irregularis DAH-3]|eukprot:OLL26281.1 Eukaryotic translation initiation factor 3 subunit L [Neolecta irregularis DAH-3]
MATYDFDQDNGVDLVVGALDNALYDSDIPKVIQSEATQQLSQDIPTDVRDYISYFYSVFLAKKNHEMHACYESSFNKLTDKYYRNSAWPEAETIAPLVNHDLFFLAIYKELYFRHCYSKLQPTKEQRVQSYENYCEFFRLVLNSDDIARNDVQLPTHYIWDVIDEFIYQFQSFCTYRNRLSKKSEQELNFLKQNCQVWNSYDVLNVLYSLIQKSKMIDQLKAAKQGQDPNTVAGDFGKLQIYRALGYFSIIGLLRVHCLLGDFTLALQMLEHVDSAKQLFLPRLTACYLSKNYYVGFAYMMLRRYSDAINTFVPALDVIARTKQLNSKSSQFDQFSKKVDQIYALMTICYAVCQKSESASQNLHNTMREKYGEQLAVISHGGPEALSVVEELFVFGCPKFINALTDYEVEEEPQLHHREIFMLDIKNQLAAPVVRSYMKLYTTMSIEKLGTFLQVDTATLRRQLIVAKQKSKQYRNTSGSLLEGEITNSSDLDFALHRDVIKIAEAKTSRKYADWFVRNTYKYHSLQDQSRT